MRNPSPEAAIAQSYKETWYEGIKAKEIPGRPADPEHLVWMLEQITMEYMSRTKANRWLGYVQGVMVCNGMLNVSMERDRTRHIFNGD